MRHRVSPNAMKIKRGRRKGSTTKGSKNRNQGGYTPLVLSANVDMEENVGFSTKRLAGKRKMPVEVISSWLACKINT